MKISSTSLLSNGWISDLGSRHCDPDRHQNLITCCFYHPRRLHKISSQSVDNLLSNVTNRQNKDKQTNATENITSFAKEVIRHNVDFKRKYWMAFWFRHPFWINVGLYGEVINIAYMYKLGRQVYIDYSRSN